MRSQFFNLLKKPFFGRFRVPWQNPLPEEEKLHWQAFRLQSKSGAQIQTLWRPADQPRGTVVLGHPMGKAAKGVFLKNGHTSRLIAEGFNVMVFDANGFGESEQGNFYFFHDIEVVGQKAKALSGGLPMGYHGISLGGMWVCPVLSKATNPFQYVILESTATSLPEFWKHYPVAYRVLMFSFLFIPRKAEYLKPINHVANFQGVSDMLLIYSDSDIYTPLSMGKRFEKASNIPAELWNPAGAEHALAFKSHTDQYWEKVIGFFDQKMRKV